MPQWDNSEQGTGAWLMARMGCLTASRMADAMAFNKKGEPLEARRKYQFELLAERLTDCMVERYVTPAMQHGIVTEPEAKELYEETTGQLITNCGFALHDTIEYCGASPDGLLSDDGLIEIKCPTSQTHIEWMLAGEVPEKHKPQMLLQMAVTGRKWCDFMSYDPRLPAVAQVFIKRFEPDPADIAAVEEHAVKFLTEVETMFNQITQGELK